MSWLDRILSGFRKADPRKQLTDDVIAELARRGIETTNVDMVQWSIEVDSGEHHHTIGFYNLSRMIEMREPAERSELIARFVDGVLTAPLPFDNLADASDRLMPLVRSRSEVSLKELRIAVHAARSSDAGKPYCSVWRPLTGDLVVMLGIDHPDIIQSLDQASFENSELKFDQALERALTNFRNQEFNFAFERLDDGIDAFFCGSAEDYQTSLITLPPSAFLGELELQGAPVILVPSRNQMFIADAADPKAIESLVALASADPSDLPHPCSTKLYTHDGVRWMEYEPTAGTDMAAAYARVRQFSLHWDYEEQKAVLEALHEATADDIFVAQAMLYEKDDKLYSASSWVERVTDGWLPKTDHIAFVRAREQEDTPTEDILQVPWDKAMPIVGEMLDELPDLYPPRFRYTHFPTDEQLAELKTLSIL